MVSHPVTGVLQGVALQRVATRHSALRAHDGRVTAHYGHVRARYERITERCSVGAGVLRVPQNSRCSTTSGTCLVRALAHVRLSSSPTSRASAGHHVSQARLAIAVLSDGEAGLVAEGGWLLMVSSCAHCFLALAQSERSCRKPSSYTQPGKACIKTLGVQQPPSSASPHSAH